MKRGIVLTIALAIVLVFALGAVAMADKGGVPNAYGEDVSSWANGTYVLPGGVSLGEWRSALAQNANGPGISYEVHNAQASFGY